jgi:hypothetical protein
MGAALPHEVEDFEAARKVKQVKAGPRKRRTRAESVQLRKDIIRLHLEGLTGVAIAWQLGVSAWTVSTVISAARGGGKK